MPISTNPQASKHQELVSSCRILLQRAQEISAAQCEDLDSRLQINKALQHLELAFQQLDRIGRPLHLQKTESRRLASLVSEHAARMLASTEPKEASAPVEPMSRSTGRRGFQGNTSTIALPDLIGFLGVQGKDGVLTVTTPEETIDILFEAGHLVHAQSHQPPPGTRLGEILIEQNALAPDQLKPFLERCREKKGRIGQHLEDEDLVSLPQITAALEQQVQRLFQRLFRCQEASFVFAEGLPEETGCRMQWNVTQLLLESARYFDEQAMPVEARD